jgi:hypothetical protein
LVKTAWFFPLVEKVWKEQVLAKSPAAKISAKFKSLRYELKRWVKGLSRIKILIEHCNTVILFF